MQQCIDIEHESEKGSISGYISDDSTYLTNYLSEFLSNDQINEILTALSSKETSQYAIIKNINVDEDARNQGIGTNLMECFLDECYVAETEYCFLISDTNESNEFDLVNWYESFDFKPIAKMGVGILMSMDMQL